MSSNDYVQHMTNKYKLAVAIAVLTNKPENLNTEQYIEQLKNSISGHEMVQNDADIFNFTIEEGDFSFDENDDVTNELEENCDLTKNEQICTTNSLNLEAITENPNAMTNKNKNVEVNLVQNSNASIQKGARTGNDEFQEVISDETNLDDVLRSLRDIDENEVSPKTNSAAKQSTFALNLETSTQLVDEKLKAKVVKHVTKNTSKYEEKGEKLISRKENFEVIIEGNTDLKDTYDMEVDFALDEIRNEQEDEYNNTFVNEVTQVDELDNLTYNKVTKINFDKSNKNEFKTPNKPEEFPKDPQATVIYTLQGFTQNTSYISQSQQQNTIEIPRELIYGTRNNNISDNFDNNNINGNSNNNDMNNINERLDSEHNIDRDVTTSDLENQNKTSRDEIKTTISQNRLHTIDSSQIQFIIDVNGKSYEVLQSRPMNTDPSFKDITNIDTQDIQNNELEQSNEIDNEMVKQGFEKDVENNDNGYTEQTQSNTEEMIDVDIPNSLEVVPFKVIKELSKVKEFLNRRDRRRSTDGFSSDSGYRSDSQNSFKGVRFSDQCMHQSAYCLFRYIAQCQLVAGTEEIITEISQVLGRLVDKLHDEEKYPAFVEELLDRVEQLLRELHYGSDCEDILLVKEETIQRLLLLNKSSHILKFSIEKIANILEKVHSILVSQENLYEIINTNEVENLRYTFHILEIFIQKYKNDKNLSQNTQNSQDTKILKRSSITEIWRKKWNSQLKEEKSNNTSQEKHCVLTKSGEILKKIIVDCMEGYSLITFAALQCFNLLQS